MASAIIHIAVANEVNKKLKRDSSKLLIGSIAPDLSKLVGQNKIASHFLDNETDIPNIDLFLNKYKNYLDDDFVLGYYIHLYTDYLWFKYFVTEIINNDYITKKDGTIVKLNGNMKCLYIYNDYTNLNIQLIDKYNLNLKIFYNEIPTLEYIIEEIPMEKLNLLINQAGVIIENSKENKNFIFDIKNVSKFIETSTKLILAEIEKINSNN
ncbi:MAG: hypothetical protein E7169_00555 [Firmicutes bacterium]|nr:hypothetical protein [Bacillota bacterium]